MIWQNFAGTLIVDAVGIALAATGHLDPVVAAFIHVGSELLFSAMRPGCCRGRGGAGAGGRVGGARDLRRSPGSGGADHRGLRRDTSIRAVRADGRSLPRQRRVVDGEFGDQPSGQARMRSSGSIGRREGKLGGCFMSAKCGTSTSSAERRRAATSLKSPSRIVGIGVSSRKACSSVVAWSMMRAPQQAEMGRDHAEPPSPRSSSATTRRAARRGQLQAGNAGRRGALRAPAARCRASHGRRPHPTGRAGGVLSRAGWRPGPAGRCAPRTAVDLLQRHQIGADLGQTETRRSGARDGRCRGICGCCRKRPSHDLAHR